MQKVQLGREEQMLAFFVQNCNGRVGRTQLIKFLYLADYEARRFLGRPISSVVYEWYHYGPYDHQFQSRLSTLRNSGVILEEPVAYPNGLRGYIYVSGETQFDLNFDPDEVAVLEHVCKTYSRINLQSLLDDIVYETEPMRNAQQRDARNQPLEMNLVDSSRRFDLGVPYDVLMRRKAAARRGEVVDHAEAMTRLREARRNGSS